MASCAARYSAIDAIIEFSIFSKVFERAVVTVWCVVEIGCDGGDYLVECRPKLAADDKRGDLRGD